MESYGAAIFHSGTEGASKTTDANSIDQTVSQEWISPYERAAVGVFCGNVNAILPVCSRWEDNLWAYMKSLVDIRVESEIRDCCTKDSGYLPLPEEYWLQRYNLRVFQDPWGLK